MRPHHQQQHPVSFIQPFTLPTPVPPSRRRRRPLIQTPLSAATPPPSSPTSHTPHIPAGATLIPPLDSPLLHRLDNLTFNYERPAPCRLRYRCRHGHVVSSLPNTPSCHSCPKCHHAVCTPQLNTSRRRLSLCQLQEHARLRGGVLVSSDYINARTPLVWRCERGHSWRATAGNVRSANSWCPECARIRKKGSIEQMHTMARQLGGTCLSTDYISEHVKLKWSCQKGHVFYMAPNNIRRRSDGKRKPSWCKVCAKENRALRAARGDERLLSPLKQQRARKLARVMPKMAL